VGKRLVVICAAAALVVALIALYISSWVTVVPPSVDAASVGPGGSGGAQLTLQTVAAVGPRLSSSRPHWVSYLVYRNGKWERSTNFTLPANSLVRVTVYNYDGESGLRNPYFSQPQGTTGGTEVVDGKTVRALDSPDYASHTFAIPGLGIFVPIPGVKDDAKNPCDTAPCALSNAHRTVTFSFRTGGKGRFRWQCFVPCAAGTITGFGGAMQTIGYMDGFVKVV